jgi:hypothetical protein
MGGQLAVQHQLKTSKLVKCVSGGIQEFSLDRGVFCEVGLGDSRLLLCEVYRQEVIRRVLCHANVRARVVSKDRFRSKRLRARSLSRV